MVEIKGSVWFSLMSCNIIGIVTTNNGYEEKAYIGIGQGLDTQEDEKHIASYGTPFPLKQAKELI